MRFRVNEVPADARRFLPEATDDASGIGVNYADAFLRALKTTLDDGRKVTCKRRGLKITMKIGEASGEGLMRRLRHGPDVERILHQALVEAAAAAGATYTVDEGVIYLELE